MELNKELLVKYITGSAGAEETRQVETWLDESPAHMEEYLDLEKTWRDARLAGDPALLDADKAFERLRSRLGGFPAETEKGLAEVLPFRNPRTGFRRMVRVAAIVGGALVLGAGIFYRARWKSRSQGMGERQIVRIEVPKGQKKHVYLADSTELWLNAGSVLRVESGYGISSRQVYLEGEGYFKVKHDARMVFTVTTPYYTIRDIGTAFNIHTYSGDSRFEAAVLEGEISVEGRFSRNNTPSKIVLSHNQVLKIKKDVIALGDSLHAQADAHGGAVVGNPASLPDSSLAGTASGEPLVSLTQSAKVSRYAGWKEDELVYDDENFRDIANGLERKYNVIIKIEDSRLADYHFTGSFKGLPDVASVLDILKETTPLIYEIRNDTLILKSRRGGR